MSRTRQAPRGSRSRQRARGRSRAFYYPPSRSRGGFSRRPSRSRSPFSPQPTLSSRAAKGGFSLLWSSRRALAPVVATFSLWVLSLLAHASSDGTKTVVTFVVLVGLVLGWSLYRRKRSRGVQYYAWLLWLTCSGWMITASLVGSWPGTLPTGIMCLLMFVAFWCFAPFWWYHYRVRSAPKGDEKRIWDEMIACPGGVLVDSHLTDIKHTKDGWTAVVVLPGGIEDSESALRAQRRIASAYASGYGTKQKISLSAVTLEGTDDQRADLLKLSVFKDNPTHEKTLYSSELFAETDGCVPVCTFPDRRHGMVRIWKRKSGAFHVLIAGDIGSGKSRMVDLFLTQANRTGLVHTWFIDPQGGNSSAAWAGEMGRAKWVARTPDQALRMLQAAERVMYARSNENKKIRWTDKSGTERMGRDYFEPTVDRPIIQLVIEEAPSILASDEMLVIVEAIALMARKCGIQLVLVAQWPGLDQLGGSNALRGQLKAGSIVSMRIGESVGGQILLPDHIMATASPAAMPKSFPNGQDSAGTCVIDSSAPGSSRGVYGRAYLLEDEDEESTSPYWADLAAEQSPELELEAIIAAGAEFQHYREYGTWPSTHGGPDMTKGGSSTGPTDGPRPPQTASEKVLGLFGDAELVERLGVDGKVQLALIAREIEEAKNTTYNALVRLQDKGVVQPDGTGRWSLVRSEVRV